MTTNRDKLNTLSTEDFVEAILGRILTTRKTIICMTDLDEVRQDLLMWLNMEVNDDKQRKILLNR